MKHAVRFFLLVSLLSILAAAQTNLGRIIGTITDQSGAVVTGAKVTISNPDTGLNRVVTSTEAGEYAAPSLPPGLYNVTVEAANFKKVDRKGIRVEVAKDVDLDLQLQPGATTEVVEVSGEAPLVETSNDTLGGTFSNRSINELPLNGRDFQNLVVLRPGVQRSPGGGFLSISSNGVRPEDNNFIVDGTDNNDPYYGTTVINAEGVQGTPGTILPIDAIQEFNAEENPPAEYGWKPGAIINLGLKSGTNALHGTAYLFERNNAFDARNWFDQKPASQRALRQHQYGGSIGGPIIKDRTFFFGAFEGIRALVSNSNVINTPATTSVGGDPSISIPDAIADLSTHGIAVNPLSANLIGTGSFTGNGSYPGLFPTNTTGTDALTVGFPNTNHMQNFIGKIDHKLSDKHQLSGRYFFGKSFQKEQDITVVRPEWLSTSDLTAQVLGVTLTSIPSSQWTNEAKFGWNRFWQAIVTADAGRNPSTFGIQTGVTDPANFGMPTIIISGFNNPTLGGNRSWPLLTTPNTTYQFADNVSYLHGKHYFRFGGEYRHGATDNLRDRSGKGRIRFEGGNAFASSTPLEDFLAGVPSRGDIFVGNSRRHVTIQSLGFFFQDDFKVSPRFTLNLGARYDLNGVIHEEHNLLANFDPRVGFIQVGVNAKRPYNPDRNNVAPRIGFAYDLFGNGKTVLRGGYGITYEIPHLAVFLGQNGTNNATTPGLTVIPTGAPGSPIAGNIAAQGVRVSGSQINWTSGTPVFSAATLTPNCLASPCDILGVDQNLTTPYVHNYNINVQQQLYSSASLQIAYVGTKGRSLYAIHDINQFNPATGTSPLAARFPFLGYVNFMDNSYTSDYNGLQATFTQRDYHGVSFVMGYTYSHSIDQASLNRSQNPQDSNNLRGERGNSDLDIRHRLTLSLTYNLPGREGMAQLLKGWSVNSIVTAQGGTPWNVVDGFVNGNDISGTGEFSDRWNFFGNPSQFKAVPGQPIPFFDFTTPATTNATCLAHADPAQLATFGCYAVGNNVLTPPNAGTFGTMGRNIFRGPGLYDWDFSLIKNFQLGERLNMQLRGEFFNILNHPNFANPATAALGNIDPSVPGAFGCSCSTPDVGAANPVIGTGGPRNIQLGVKFRF